MKHQVSFIIKLLGFICLIIAIISVLTLFSSILTGFDRYFFFISILPITALFMCFILCIYKTNQVIDFFKLSEVEDLDEPQDKPYSMSRRTAFKSGIFIIGMYLLATNAPNVLVQLVSWLAYELEGRSESIHQLVEVLSPFNRDSIFFSVIYAIAGYLIALENSRIATYFLKKDEE